MLGRPDPDLEICARHACPGGLPTLRSDRVKTPLFVADDGDACERRMLLEDVVVVLIFFLYGLGSGYVLRRFSSSGRFCGA